MIVSLRSWLVWRWRARRPVGAASGGGRFPPALTFHVERRTHLVCGSRVVGPPNRQRPEPRRHGRFTWNVAWSGNAAVADLRAQTGTRARFSWLAVVGLRVAAGSPRLP